MALMGVRGFQCLQGEQHSAVPFGCSLLWGHCSHTRMMIVPNAESLTLGVISSLYVIFLLFL